MLSQTIHIRSQITGAINTKRIHQGLTVFNILPYVPSHVFTDFSYESYDQRAQPLTAQILHENLKKLKGTAYCYGDLKGFLHSISYLVSTKVQLSITTRII